MGRGRGIMYLLRTRAVPVTVSLGVGLLLGLLGPAAGKWDNPACVAIATVFSGGWPWACYAFLVGHFRRSKIESALLASLGLTIGVVAYYALKDMSPAIPDATKPVSSSMGMNPGNPGEGISSQILVWGTAAFILGAPIGLFGNLARIPGIEGLGFRLIVPIIAFCESSMRLSVEVNNQVSAVGMTWNIIRLVAGAVALALAGRTILSWWHGRPVRKRSEGSICTYDTSPPPDRR